MGEARSEATSRRLLIMLEGTNMILLSLRSSRSSLCLTVPDALQVLPWLEDEAPRVLDSDPHGVAPGCDGLLVPVVGANVCHHTGVVDELGVVLDGDEVRVCPLLVEEAQVLIVLLGERNLAVVTLAPCCHDELSSRLQ